MNNNFSSSNLQKYWAYVPGMPTASIAIKIGLSIIILGICVFLLIPVPYKNYDLVKQTLTYSPVKQVRDYYAELGPKAAFDFINFYESLPGVVQNPELMRIKEEANSERSRWTYIGKELGLGLLGMKPHENYAKYAKSAVKFVPYANDIHSASEYANELIQEYRNYKNGTNIDMLHLGVASLGLIEVAIGLLPGDNPTINKLKPQTHALLDSLKMLNPKLRDEVANVLNPIFNKIEKSDLAQDKDGNALVQIIKDKSSQFMTILKQAEDCLNNFQGLVNLEKKNENLVPVVVSSSTNFNELKENSELAEEIAKLNPDVLLYGGDAALQAANRLKNEGKFDIKTLEAAMKYGQAGLKTVGIIPINQLEKEIKNISDNHSASHFRFPLIIILLIIVVSIVFLAKTWIPINKEA